MICVSSGNNTPKKVFIDYCTKHHYLTSWFSEVEYISAFFLSWFTNSVAIFSPSTAIDENYSLYLQLKMPENTLFFLYISHSLCLLTTSECSCYNLGKNVTNFCCIYLSMFQKVALQVMLAHSCNTHTLRNVCIKIDYLYSDIYGTCWSESVYEIVQETAETLSHNMKTYY